jgi:uncharacterized protein (DUF1501 family)
MRSEGRHGFRCGSGIASSQGVLHKGRMPAREKDPYDARQFQAAIKAALAKSGVADHSIGGLAEIAPKAIPNFLKGGPKKTIQLDTLVRVAAALEISLGELLGLSLPAASPEAPEARVAEMREIRDQLHRIAVRLGEL